MDRDEILMALQSLNERITDNHSDTVQRLTRVETRLDAIPPLTPIEARVRRLEGWRNGLAGGFIVLGYAAKSALAYLKR